MADSVLARLLQRVRSRVVPPLSLARHKGQAGRVGVVGGCRLYTGAPYYAAMSSLRAGGDLAFVFCTPDAAGPIKSYSPELMVDAALREGGGGGGGGKEEAAAVEQRRERVVASVAAYMPRMHVLLVGPGLGRDEFTLSCVAGIMERARAAGLPVVVDGDALYLLAQRPDLVRGYARAVLTPNAAEFARLWRAVVGGGGSSGGDDDDAAATPPRGGPPPDEHALGSGATTRDGGDLPAAVLARALGGVTVLSKGHSDWVTNGREAWQCAAAGSPRRCGGQGDVLAGTVATFAGWAAADAGGGDESMMLAAFGASCAVRAAAAAAFRKHARGTVTTDIIPELAPACQRLYPVDIGAGLAAAGWQG